MNYYNVIAKCGHVGKRKYIEVGFPVYANSASEAAKMVLKYRKVKKQLKDAISKVLEITYEEYLDLVNENHNNSYLKSHYKREIDISIYEIREFSIASLRRKESMDRIERVLYKQRKNKLLLEAFKYEYVY